MEKYKEIVEITAQWNRSAESHCMPCYPMVGEGGIQCVNCLALFHGKEGKKQAIKCLKELRGEFWKEEWKNMQKVIRLVSVCKFSKLRELHYSYQDKDGIIDNERKFYEIIN